MEAKFCSSCGTSLTWKEIGDEGLMPFCPQCHQPVWPTFPVAVIALVHYQNQVLVLHQNYISTCYANLVSGYMKPGERAEETVVREIKEETNLDVIRHTFAGSYWFAKKGMLMLAFQTEVASPNFRLSPEVDAAEWVSVEQALQRVHPQGSVSHTLVYQALHEPTKETNV